MLGSEIHLRYLHVGTSGLLLSFAHNCKLCSHRVLNWCIGRSIPVSVWKSCISVFGVFRCTLWCIPMHDSFTIWTGMPSKISCCQKTNLIFILNLYRLDAIKYHFILIMFNLIWCVIQSICGINYIFSCILFTSTYRCWR